MSLKVCSLQHFQSHSFLLLIDFAYCDFFTICQIVLLYFLSKQILFSPYYTLILRRFVFFPHQFDVSTEKGLASFNGAMALKSYVEGAKFSQLDIEYFSQFSSCPDQQKQPHAYRWYKHIKSLQGVRGLGSSAPLTANTLTYSAAPTLETA